jgi:GAF domain-containing protein
MWRITEELAATRNDEELLDHVAGQLMDPEAFLHGVSELYAHPELDSFDVLRFRDGRVFEPYSTPEQLNGEIVGRVWSFREVTEREQLFRHALFLTDAARLLASLDIDNALDAVARLSVPLLGEACAVDLLEEEGFRRLLTISATPDRSIPGDLPPAVYAGHGTTFSVATASYLSVPIVARGRVLGIITLAAQPERAYAPRDLDLAEELARRAALSVENARVYAKAQEALRARDEFLAIAAHEIRGPITSIHLAVQSLTSPQAPTSSHTTLRAIIEREDRRLAASWTSCSTSDASRPAGCSSTSRRSS